MTMTDLGKKIKSIRKSLKLTQEEFAEKIEINAKHLSRLEIGTHKPSLETIKKISKIFNVSLSELGFHDEEFNYSETFYQLVEILKISSENELKIFLNLINNLKGKIK